LLRRIRAIPGWRMDNSTSTSSHPAVAPVDHVFLKRLRLMDTVEGVSTLVLFGVAMPLKYFAGMPVAVRIAGMAHGVLFIALVMMFIVGIKKVPLRPGIAAMGIIAAVFPFGPFLMNRVLDKVDRA
jgi:integral membrane protein